MTMSNKLTPTMAFAFAIDLVILICKFLIYQKMSPQVTQKEDLDIQHLKSLDKSLFTHLESILSRTKLSKKAGEEDGKKNNGSFRKGFSQHRADVFGIVKRRAVNGGGFAISKISQQKKELYDELKRIGDQIVPFKYSSILVNNNTVCGKHKDKSNVGKSFLVSIGDYDGCKLVIENKSYSTRYQPLIFNGAKFEHWNTNDLKGNKYSIVYYYIENDIL